MWILSNVFKKISICYLLCKIEKDIVEVVAILDMRRNPSFISTKLGKRKR